MRGSIFFRSENITDAAFKKKPVAFNKLQDADGDKTLSGRGRGNLVSIRFRILSGRFAKPKDL